MMNRKTYQSERWSSTAIGIVFAALLLSCMGTSPAPIAEKPSVKEVKHVSLEAPRDQALEVAYIGNMGVLVEKGESTVLIDGLHDFYKPAYAHPDAATIDALIAGNYPNFTSIEMDLVTHEHGDHFDSDITARFLEENPEALCIVPAPVHEMISEAAVENEEVMERVLIATDQDGPRHTAHAGIQIISADCKHSYPARHSAIANVAHLITMGETRILHVGDTDRDFLIETCQALDLQQDSIDLVIFPSWLLLSDWPELEEYILAGQLLATHIDPREAESRTTQVQKYFPEAICLTELGWYGEFPLLSKSKD
ncbi:MAG: MBL fold metallo-hydrolase [Flavobacteriales bacterium]|nr:MBL fold metallo-hydrolase [Flavobacteriales bacterium]